MNRNQIIEEFSKLVDVKEMSDYRDFTDNLTFNLMTRRLDHDDEYLMSFKSFPIIDENEFIVYTRSLLNNEGIKRPSRTVLCRHIETVELNTLIQNVITHGTCPLCGVAEITLDNIYVDKTFENILIDEAVGSTNFFILSRNNPKVYRPYCETSNTEAMRHNENENLVKMNRGIDTPVREGRIYEEFSNVLNILLNKK
jgi:hypothetical protein